MSPAAETLNRRDRKREATRAALEQAAWELFEERGFAGTTIEAITERADVAVRTFFRYFESKDAVLFGDPREFEFQFRDALLARPPDENIVNALRSALVEIAEVVVAPARDRHLLRRRILQEHGNPRLDDDLGAFAAKAAMLRDVIAERLGRRSSDLPVRLLGGVAVTIIDVAYTRWIDNDGADDIRTIVEQTFASLDQLLCSDEIPE